MAPWWYERRNAERPRGTGQMPPSVTEPARLRRVRIRVGRAREPAIHLPAQELTAALKR